ncbi:uncharacterized protein LOC113465177 isoform X1 [Ceratina calcarata]|uniref:Uncharacterized protein LOC113465177 isoform X1 n=1 Tax=Ceratina calcarata TaxID=156304 RepID=A0AAJ7SBQ7_9HYME|nr:uncharacterized protein LOC113465177 isoform X1 [Ceratina calcarata]
MGISMTLDCKGNRLNCSHSYRQTASGTLLQFCISVTITWSNKESELRSWHELIESHKSAVRTNDSVRRTRAATDGGRLKSSVRKCLNEHKPRRTVLVRASEYVCTFTIASSWPFIHAGKVGECRDRFSNPGSRSQ